MDASVAGETLVFEGWRFDPRAGGLLRQGADGAWVPVPIGTRARDLLALLLQRPGALVSKDSIMDAVWPNVTVEPNNLTVQIATLRRTLDEGRAGNSCIETVPGRGYRFLPHVTRLASGQSDAAPAPVAEPPPARVRGTPGRLWLWLLAGACAAGVVGLLAWGAWPGQSPPARLSLVVLPFQNLGNASDDYLADGITDDLISDLLLIPDALVIARGTTYAYRQRPRDLRQIGRDLGVRYAVEGSTRRIGDILRIDAQLSSTETGVELWADRFDEPITNLAAGQEEIVTRMRTGLDINLFEIEKARSLRERPASPDAFDLILQARALYNQPPDLQRHERAHALFERALALDPSSVSAITWVVLCLLEQADNNGGWGAGWDNLEARQRTERLVTQANAIAPESRLTLGATFQWLRSQGRCDEAMPVAEKMIERFPNHALAYAYLGSCKLVTGHADEDIVLEKRAIRLNPRDPNIFLRYARLGIASLLLGKEQDAIEYLGKALALEGEFGGSKAYIHRGLAAAYARGGKMEQAKHALADADRLFAYDTVRGHFPDDPSSTVLTDQIRAYQAALRLAGERDHADEAADFGVPSDDLLHRRLIGPTPKDAPGVTTIRTADLMPFLANARPILLDAMTYTWGKSIPGAIGLRHAGLGGSFTDTAQDRLGSKLRELTGGDRNRPIVAVGWNSERFDGRNLALRLVALGYRQVYWYRGGREAWEVAGLPETDVTVQDW
jgi:TolB-like protein/DNA-binding winged helix-turn-helix (wHTH) protein/rhodanese-related sulfurtransferase